MKNKYPEVIPSSAFLFETLNYLETIYISHHQENVFNKNKKYPPDVIKTLCEQFPSNYLPKIL